MEEDDGGGSWCVGKEEERKRDGLRM